MSHPTTSWNITVKTIILWALQLFGAYTFISAGIPKIIGDPMMIGLFDAVGVGQWLRYVTGVTEFTAGIMLLVPSLAGVGALLLAGVMVGAIMTHLFIIGGSITMPLILLVTMLIIAYSRREETRKLIGR